MKNKYRQIIFIVGFLLMATLAFPTKLKLVHTISPEQPFKADKIVVYKDFIYLLSTSENSVIGIDKSGKTVRQLASSGEGPGEFKYIADFDVFQDQFIIAGGRRIQIFSSDGKVIQLIKTKKNVEKVFAAGKQWFYSIGWYSINRETRKVTPLIALCNPAGTIMQTFPDESLQNAYHPGRDGKFVHPWFPSPFHNRLIFVSGNGTNSAMFMSRRKEFHLIDNERLLVQPIKVKLETRKVTDQDKTAFFERIEPKPHKKTQMSVVFPETIEYFLGVIPWNKGWALITPDSIVVLNDNGSHKETIALPDTLKEVVDEVGWPEEMMFKGKELYVIKESEVVMVFSLQKSEG